jgi:hypothetical protein
MPDIKEKKHGSTREWLTARVSDFLKKNPKITPEQFGWLAIRDASLVGRLKKGGDVTTRKLDDIIRFMSKPHTGSKSDVKSEA